MKCFIVHDGHDNVLRHGNCQDNNFEQQAGPGEFVIEGQINTETQKLSNGKVVDKTPQEIAMSKSGPRPSDQEPADLTRGQLDEILRRIKDIERKLP